MKITTLMRASFYLLFCPVVHVGDLLRRLVVGVWWRHLVLKYCMFLLISYICVWERGGGDLTVPTYSSLSLSLQQHGFIHRRPHNESEIEASLLLPATTEHLLSLSRAGMLACLLVRLAYAITWVLYYTMMTFWFYLPFFYFNLLSYTEK